MWDKISWHKLHCTYVYIMTSSYTKTTKRGQPTWQIEYVLDPYFFNLISLIRLCDKKNLTFVDCWDKILLNLSWKMLLSSPKDHLITFSKTRLIKSYVNSQLITDPIFHTSILLVIINSHKLTINTNSMMNSVVRNHKAVLRSFIFSK